MTAKEQIISSITEWIDLKIDTVISSNPRAAIFSPYIKQGVDNFIISKEKNIDDILMFITDKEGKLNIGNFFEEAIKVFEDMPTQTYHTMGMDISVGKGLIEINAPDNYLVNLVMPKRKITLNSDDIMELRQILLDRME